MFGLRSEKQILQALLVVLSLRSRMLWDTFDMDNFYFLFLFSDFIGILFYFVFFLDNEEAHDNEVTWHVTWCDVIGLEGGKRI